MYEVYKVGADPVWAEGLDLLTPLGMTVAVIPHYDNAEGGSHDTRYCYLGEGRLEIMEAQLPPEGWVLGVDEHTACIFDFEAGTATVMGLGVGHHPPPRAVGHRTLWQDAGHRRAGRSSSLWS